MTRIQELAEAALRTEHPAANLELMVRDLIKAGETREAIGDELDGLVAALRVDDDETIEEELVLEILDRLRGWCSPDARL